MTARHFAMIRGTLTEISEAEANARYYAPADGTYDDDFRRRFREHQDAVTARFDGRRPGDSTANPQE